MAINSIGSSYYNNGLNGVSNISNILSYNSKNTSLINKSINSAFKNKSAAQYLGSDSYSFVSSYNKSMTDLMQSANALRKSNPASGVNGVSASSSNENVAAVTSSNGYNENTQSVSINVSQVAQAQTNKLSAGSLPYAGDASFSISSQSGRGGEADIYVSRTKANGNRKTDDEFLNDIATQINKKNIGVTAKVEKGDDGKSVLSISGNSGEANTFSVSGDFAEKTGLSDIAQSAQNAEYSVTENGKTQSYSSASNEVSINSGKAKLELKGEGETTISAKADNTSSVVSGVKDLVEKYNNAVKLLNNNSSRGEGVKEQLNRMGMGALHDSSLNKLGITKNEDGSLSLDEDKLKSALANDEKNVMNLITGRNGLAENTFNIASSGLSKTASNLIGYDIKNAEISNAQDAMYRSAAGYGKGAGAYTAMNLYTVSYMMNYSMMNYLV